MNPRTLRRTHLYLGALFAPILLAFTVSGAWQVYRLNDSRKEDGYTPPKIIKVLSSIHKNQNVSRETPNRTAIKAFVFLAALALITTTLLGIAMAYRFTASPVTVTICLLAGIAVPVVLLLFTS